MTRDIDPKLLGVILFTGWALLGLWRRCRSCFYSLAGRQADYTFKEIKLVGWLWRRWYSAAGDYEAQEEIFVEENIMYRQL